MFINTTCRYNKMVKNYVANKKILSLWLNMQNVGLIMCTQVLLTIFLELSARQKKTWQRTISVISFLKFHSAVAVDRLKMSRPILKRRPGRSSLFFCWPLKHKLGRGRWVLTSCQVSSNSIQRLQRRSWKCLGQSGARAAIFAFRFARKTKTC